MNEEVITSCSDTELYNMDKFVVSSDAGYEATGKAIEVPSHEEDKDSTNNSLATLRENSSYSKIYGKRSFKQPFSHHLLTSDLTHEDLSALLQNRMLNDKIINFFQNMLKREFKNAAGLQDTLLGQKLRFKAISCEPLVQVLHDGKLHWMVVSTKGCDEGEVTLMDRAFTGTVNQTIKRQICNTLQWLKAAINVKIVAVQQQKNAIDCGIFAIAFVQSILLGYDVSLMSYDDAKMRSHMLICLLKNKLEQFPLSTTKIKRCQSKTIKISVFCICRQMWLKADNRTIGG